MPDLLAPDDADLLAYVSDQETALTGRESFLVRAACEIVRDYCGWHIAPSITATYDNLRIGSGGIIMVPSGYVTDVASVTIRSPGGDVILDPTTEYDWYPQGFIEAKSPQWRYGYGAVYGPYKAGLASVAMTHGYDTCPLPVKSVIFELMDTADMANMGGVKEVQSASFRVQWGPLAGLSFTPSQVNRLAKYAIGGVG